MTLFLVKGTGNKKHDRKPAGDKALNCWLKVTIKG